MSRFAKQLLYGTFYLVLFGGVAWGIYSVTLKPAPSCFDTTQNGSETGVDCGGPCMSCEVKHLQPLFVGEASLLGDNRAYTAEAELQNPNQAYGATEFTYIADFYDASGVLLKSVTNTSFAYPGRTKDLIAAGVSILNGIPASVKITLDPSSVIWAKAVDFSEPKYELKDVVAGMEGNLVAVSGIITNPNNFPFSKVIVEAFVADNLGIKVGASKTELSDVGQFRQQSFKISIPVRKDLLKNLDLGATAGSVSVEVLK